MTSYPKFPRSNIPGEVPVSLDPGSFGVNWADRKIFVGGPTGVPQLVGFPLRDFRETSAYRVGDVVIQNSRIWRCDTAFLSPASFNENDWTDLTAGTINDAKDLTSSVLLSGGNLTAPGGVVTVSAGSGIQMNVSNPADPMPFILSWGALTITGPYAPNSSLVASITGGGLLILTDAATFVGNLQRTTIRVGMVTTDDLGAVVTVKDDARVAYQSVDTLTDLLQTLGPIKRSGLILTNPAPNAVEVGPGEAFWPGVNWDASPSNPNSFIIPSAQGLSVRMASRNGYEIAAAQPLVDPTFWDNAGVMQLVPSGKYTNQFVLLNPDRTAMVTYGQRLYDSIEEAEVAIASAWAEIVLPAVSRGLLMIGCLTTDNTGFDQSATSPNVRAGAPFDDGGVGNLADYFRIDGSSQMDGDLDLGGNRIENGVVDGSLVAIEPRELTITGDAPAPSATDLSINIVDRKIFYGDDLISQKVETFSALREYAIGDLAIQGTTIYRCTTAIVTPGVFNPADWEIIGGGGGGSLTGAMILAPSTASRNQVNLTGVGGVAKAISVSFDAGQGVDVADFGPRAIINRFGVPDRAFGGAVFVVSQATHGFTRIGTPVFFNGLIWVLADSNALASFPNAVISEIIDANNFTVQVAGRIVNLNTAAFVGGVITPGTYYYASSTPGLMTSTPGATPVPVLYTTSATTGIVKLTGTVIPTVLTITDVVNALYPVGSIYISVDPTNPSTRYPGTTWSAYAQGRALVGVGTADGETWAVGDLKGSARVTLSASEMPVHSHTGSVSVSGSTSTAFLEGGANFRRRAGNTTIISIATGIMSRVENVGGSLSDIGTGGTDRQVDALNINATHSHTVSASGSFTTNATGGDQSHQNIQPSIGVFMWRRTA
jgi:microcystin-dependent protein